MEKITTILQVLVIPLVGLLSGLLGSYLERRKRTAEATKINVEAQQITVETQDKQLDSDFKAAAGFQSLSKDYAQLAELMSDKFFAVKEDFLKMMDKYDKEIAELNTQHLQEKQEMERDLVQKDNFLETLSTILDQKKRLLAAYTEDCDAQLKIIMETVDFFQKSLKEELKND